MSARVVCRLVVAALLTAVAVVGSAAAASAGVAPAATDVADAGALAPAVRMDVPAVLETTPAEPIVNRSNCRTGTAGASMQISIADISYDCPVYTGGQSTIDAGFVTLFVETGANTALATHPGQAGTLWLAAHRTSHGGAFADVPSLADGALITVGDGVAQATYTVVGRAYVEVRGGIVVDSTGVATQAATAAAILRADRTADLAPRLLLQTCDGENHRWMIYADLVG
jgi:sortase (surface protein transpeptidase)